MNSMDYRGRRGRVAGRGGYVPMYLETSGPSGWRTYRDELRNCNNASRIPSLPHRSYTSLSSSIPHRSNMSRSFSLPHRNNESRSSSLPLGNNESRSSSLVHRSNMSRSASLPHRNNESRSSSLPHGINASRSSSLPRSVYYNTTVRHSRPETTSSVVHSVSLPASNNVSTRDRSSVISETSSSLPHRISTFPRAAYIGNYDPTIINYDPTINNYDSIISDYDPIIRNYDPTISDYDLPLTNYDPTLTNYDPTLTNYDSTIRNYDPSISHIRRETSSLAHSDILQPLSNLRSRGRSPGRYNGMSSSIDGTHDETRSHRSGSLPGHSAYGGLTGSRYSEDADTPNIARGVSIAPRNRSASPVARSSLPIRHHSPAIRRNVSPVRTTDPVRHSVSPLLHYTRPVRLNESPVLRSTQPLRHNVRRRPSPAPRTESPVRHNTHPVARRVSPVRHTTQPVRHRVTPVRYNTQPVGWDNRLMVSRFPDTSSLPTHNNGNRWRNGSLSPWSPLSGTRLRPPLTGPGVRYNDMEDGTGVRVNRRYTTTPATTYFTYSDDDDNDDDDGGAERGDSIYSPPSSNNRTELAVREVDCHVAENARAHHTERFAASRDGVLIVRRAQAFRISVILNGRFSQSKHEISVEFSTGSNPQPGKSTYIKISPDSNLHGTQQWNIKTESVIDHMVTLCIVTGPTSVVGEWKFIVTITEKNDRAIGRQRGKETSLLLLFNPWEKDDSVYFSDKAKLSEYILNDSGCIFTGSHSQISAKPWFYGQFESGILEAAVYCLTKAFKFRSGAVMGDPVRVSRAISKIVNSNDDNGVVTGNWSGNYRDGTAPLTWVGSVSILRTFLKSKLPVKYGQCFVFSGIVTTICRALGIPCRSVTNFCSAHDTDASVTVDVYWDTTEDTTLTSLNTDSMWNFHVWNDVWMKRRDLSPGNDGWQVLDSTPQETSDGEFRCGPAPLSAILNGKCDVSYDASFIFAEVNADRVHWGREDGGSWHVIGIDKAVVGKMISTKIADGKPVPSNHDNCEVFREDITDQYKYIEGSDRERISMTTASTRAPRGHIGIYMPDNDLKIEILTPTHVTVGSDFDVVVVYTNTSGVLKTLKGLILCDVTMYTGSAIHTCMEDAINVEVEPYEEDRMVLRVSEDDYVDSVAEAAMFRVALILRVKGSGQCAALETFRLNVPALGIKIKDTFLRAGVPVDITVTVINPLRTRSLTNCLIHAEYTGMEDSSIFAIRTISRGEELQTRVTITPLVRGPCSLFLTFYSDQIQDMKGTCEMFVQ